MTAERELMTERFEASGLPSFLPFPLKLAYSGWSRRPRVLCSVLTTHHGLVCQSLCPWAPRGIEISDMDPAFQRGHHHLHFILGQITETVSLSFPICYMGLILGRHIRKMNQQIPMKQLSTC